MSQTVFYHFLRHLDAPKRYLSLTIDELSVAILGFSLLVLSHHKVVSTAMSLMLLSTLRYLKHGGGPKVLLMWMYWYLPHVVTQCFLPKLPASHQRIWVA